jgi:hypothetical protein
MHGGASDVQGAAQRADAVLELKQARATRRAVVPDHDYETTVLQTGAHVDERGSSPAGPLR